MTDKGKKPAPSKQFSLLSQENKLKIRGAYRRGQKFIILGDGNKYTITLQVRNVTYTSSKPVVKVDEKQPRKTVVEKQTIKQTEKWLIVRREKQMLPFASIALDPSENVRSR